MIFARSRVIQGHSSLEITGYECSCDKMRYTSMKIYIQFCLIFNFRNQFFTMENGDDTITVTMTEEGYLSMSKLDQVMKESCNIMIF